MKTTNLIIFVDFKLFLVSQAPFTIFFVNSFSYFYNFEVSQFQKSHQSNGGGNQSLTNVFCFYS